MLRRADYTRRADGPRAARSCRMHRDATPWTKDSKIAGTVNRRDAPSLRDEAAALCVRDRFEPRVSAQLAVDVVKVVAQRLRRDPKLASDGRGSATLREEGEDRRLLIRQHLDRCVVRVLVVHG